jgi:hypothetical protein
MKMHYFGISSVVLTAIVMLAWVNQGHAAPAGKAPTIYAMAEELTKDGAFSEEDAETIALEVARRIWFPDPEQIRVSSVRQDAKGWTVTCVEKVQKPAQAGCSISVTKNGFVSEAVFHPGE